MATKTITTCDCCGKKVSGIVAEMTLSESNRNGVRTFHLCADCKVKITNQLQPGAVIENTPEEIE